MIVTQSNFHDVVKALALEIPLSLDTETTGLRPDHGDRLFSIIIGCQRPGGVEGFYFNFFSYETAPPDTVLGREHLELLQRVLFSDPSKVWYIHNAKFDMGMLQVEGLYLEGTIHCTRAVDLLVDNEQMNYTLKACAGRIGFTKDDAVEEYITKNHLWEWEEVPGKTKRNKRLFYYRVPFDIITQYGITDAQITYHLGKSQEASLQRIADETPKNLPSVLTVFENEKRLTRTVFSMERVGARIDRGFCVRAASFEADRAAAAIQEFREITGQDFKASGKLFASIFDSEKQRWQFTEKGNPSFDSDVLSTFEHPAARSVLTYRDAKAKSDFYNGFLYHADSNDRIHTTLNQDGAGTGRFSSSDPNLQNLSNEDEVEDPGEFQVRRAIIPHNPGDWLYSLDYSSMEAWLMADYAGELELIEKIKGGMDIHEATAEMMGVKRKQAKTLNFMLLYGGGAKKLAHALGLSVREAYDLKNKYFDSLPAISKFMSKVINAAEKRGYIFNWLGRIYRFPDPRFAYRAPNYLIQGSGADIMKVSLNRIHEYLKDKKTRLILTIHDEVVLNVPDNEHYVVEGVREIMETSYIPRNGLQMKCSIARSQKSLGDLVETGDSFQDEKDRPILKNIETYDSVLSTAGGYTGNPGQATLLSGDVCCYGN